MNTIEDAAYRHWLRMETYYDLCHGKPLETPVHTSSIREARELLHLTVYEVATRLGISPQAYCYLEKCEAKQKISVANLRRIATAINCDFKYEIRPKSGKSFKQMTWEAVLEQARKLPFYKSPNLTANSLAGMISALADDPDMRKILGWNTRENVKTGNTHRFIQRWWCKGQKISQRLGVTNS